MSDFDGAKTTTSKYRCPTCHMTFTSNSHLRRHETIHLRDRACECPVCKRIFLRPDTLRRHFDRCSQKGGNEVIPESKRGRKPRSCNSCRSKKAQCDGNQPCKRCSKSQAKCSYSYVNGNGSDGITTSHGTSRQVSNKSLGFHYDGVPFLLSYTDPSLEFTTDGFAAIGAHAELLVEQSEHPTETIETASDIFDGGIEGLFSGIFSDVSTNRNVRIHRPRPTALSPHQTHTLQNRTEELISQLRSQHEKGSDPHKIPAVGFPMDLAKMIFSTENLTYYVSAYFSYVHPHFPLIHRPTFDMQSADLPLLLAIFLNGSALCVPQDDALSARHFFSLAEEYIFRLLHRLIAEGDQMGTHGIQTVQAAMLILSLQSCSNDARVRHRIRVVRHPDLVAALRYLGLTGTIRTARFSAAEWWQFIAEEMRVRLVTWIFIMDCMNTVFFNNRPLVTASEMDGDLLSASALFEASTPAEFAKIGATLTHPTSLTLSVKNWISLLLQETWPGPEAADFLWAEPKHLLIIIFALHSIIFVSRTSLVVTSLYQPLLRATNRWKELWVALRARHKSEQGQFVGFTKYGPELCWLAQKLLQLTQSADSRCRYMKAIPSNSFRDLHELIKLHADG